MKKQNSDEKQTEVIDGETGKVEPAPRRIDLSSLRDVRLEMAYVYRQLDAGEIPSQDASRRVYVLGEIGKVITTAEFEKRLAAIESRMTGRLPAYSETRQLQHVS